MTRDTDDANVEDMRSDDIFGARKINGFPYRGAQEVTEIQMLSDRIAILEETITKMAVQILKLENRTPGLSSPVRIKG